MSDVKYKLGTEVGSYKGRIRDVIFPLLISKQTEEVITSVPLLFQFKRASSFHLGNL